MVATPCDTGNARCTIPDHRRPAPEAFYACVVQAFEALSPADRRRLRRWEAVHVSGGRKGTSDWPGWAGRVIGWESWQTRLACPLRHVR